ncbi:MAG: hypothetical protein FWC45_09100, partial [Treponema sp.]|nr:hypothetical protein [Treponema sp.]
LGLSAKLSLPLELDSAKITQYQAPGTDGSLIKDGVDGSLLYFSVRPVLNLGLQYQAIPGKLIINAGGRIETAQIDLSSGKFDTYNAGVKDPSNTKYKDTSFLGLAADTSNGRDAGTGLYAGVTFNFNQHIGLDTVMAYNIANPSNGVNGINLFGIGVSGSLTTFYQILVSLKF